MVLPDLEGPCGVDLDLVDRPSSVDGVEQDRPQRPEHDYRQLHGGVDAEKYHEHRYQGWRWDRAEEGKKRVDVVHARAGSAQCDTSGDTIQRRDQPAAEN